MSVHSLLLSRLQTSFEFWSEALDPLSEQLWRTTEGESLCLKNLFGRILAAPTSSADAERGFSLQNLLKTDLRNRLTLPTLDAIMRVKLNGEQEKLDFDKLARLWIRSQHQAVGVVRPRRKVTAKPCSISTFSVWLAFYTVLFLIVCCFVRIPRLCLYSQFWVIRRHRSWWLCRGTIPGGWPRSNGYVWVNVTHAHAMVFLVNCLCS